MATKIRMMKKISLPRYMLITTPFFITLNHPNSDEPRRATKQHHCGLLPEIYRSSHMRSEVSTMTMLSHGGPYPDTCSFVSREALDMVGKESKDDILSMRNTSSSYEMFDIFEQALNILTLNLKP